MSEQTQKLTVFLDNIGRTIIGKQVAENETTVSIENPALVHVQPNTQTNQLQLQILPLFFKEFQADKSESTVWDFKKNNITTCKDITFAFQFTAQYEQIFQVVEQPKSEPEVVKLFDEE